MTTSVTVSRGLREVILGSPASRERDSALLGDGWWSRESREVFREERRGRRRSRRRRDFRRESGCCLGPEKLGLVLLRRRGGRCPGGKGVSGRVVRPETTREGAWLRVPETGRRGPGAPGGVGGRVGERPAGVDEAKGVVVSGPRGARCHWDVASKARGKSSGGL